MAQLTMHPAQSGPLEDGRLTPQEVRFIPLVVPLIGVLMAVVGVIVLSVA